MGVLLPDFQLLVLFVFTLRSHGNPLYKVTPCFVEVVQKTSYILCPFTKIAYFRKKLVKSLTTNIKCCIIYSTQVERTKPSELYRLNRDMLTFIRCGSFISESISQYESIFNSITYGKRWYFVQKISRIF